MLEKAAAVFAFVLTIAAQQTGTLRIHVVLSDAAGTGTSIGTATLLLSDNPATTVPRRIRTRADGTAEIALKPGSYVLGTRCQTVRLQLFSQRDPQKPDTRTIDSKLFEQVANSLQ